VGASSQREVEIGGALPSMVNCSSAEIKSRSTASALHDLLVGIDALATATAVQLPSAFFQ
jgi:hypothetical protein